jgi:hypothetical protein
VTVPLDTFGSPFYLLFNAHCLYRGFVRRDSYYRVFCGHVNHFAPSAVRRLLREAGFVIDRQFIHNLFLIYTVARKPGRTAS